MCASRALTKCAGAPFAALETGPARTSSPRPGHVRELVASPQGDPPRPPRRPIRRGRALTAGAGPYLAALRPVREARDRPSPATWRRERSSASGSTATCGAGERQHRQVVGGVAVGGAPGQVEALPPPRAPAPPPPWPARASGSPTRRPAQAPLTTSATVPSAPVSPRRWAMWRLPSSTGRRGHEPDPLTGVEVLLLRARGVPAQTPVGHEARRRSPRCALDDPRRWTHLRRTPARSRWVWCACRRRCPRCRAMAEFRLGCQMKLGDVARLAVKHSRAA